MTAFLLILLPKFPECILLHTSKQIDFVTIANDCQEAGSCHFKIVSSLVFARVFKNVVKTPTFLSLKQSDLSKNHQNIYDVTGVKFRSPELWKDLLNSGTDSVTPLSVLPPSGKLWINLSKHFSWLAQVNQWQKTVSGAQVSNAFLGLGGYIINSSHYYCTLMSNFARKTWWRHPSRQHIPEKKHLKWN